MQMPRSDLQYTATHCNKLQHTATSRNALQHTATHYDTHCNTHTYCNTLLIYIEYELHIVIVTYV